MVAGSKKGKDGKDISSSSVISNGTSASRARQSSAPIEKSKSFNERKTGECNSKREPSVVKVNRDKVKAYIIIGLDVSNFLST